MITILQMTRRIWNGRQFSFKLLFFKDECNVSIFYYRYKCILIDVDINKVPSVASQTASNLFHYPYRNASTMHSLSLLLLLKNWNFWDQLCFLKRRQLDDSEKSLLLLKQDKGCILLNKIFKLSNFQVFYVSVNRI